MSSGHASHKGETVKSDTTVNVEVDDPQAEIPTETAYPFTADDEVDVNPAVMERPDKPSNSK